MNDYKPKLFMLIPKLVFADSALWMFHVHRCAYDPYPHPIIECGNPWPGSHNMIVAHKDGYFAADPAIDYNN